jgi:hypothetical protein
VIEEVYPRRMELRRVERLVSEWSKTVVHIGEGQCPWCGWGPASAEAGARGYCPSCAGPVLAVLAA